MSSPRNLKELRSLPGRLQPLISKARTRCQSFSRQDANFVWRPKHKEKGFLFLSLTVESLRTSRLIWSFLCLLLSCRLLLYWWATPAFRVHHRRHFLILGRYGKRRWLFEVGRKEKAIDYLRPCSQRLSTLSIWYWGEPAIKRRPKLSKRWKKHTFIYQTVYLEAPSFSSVGVG